MLITSVSVGSEAASVPHLILTRVERRDIVAKQRLRMCELRDQIGQNMSQRTYLLNELLEEH